MVFKVPFSSVFLRHIRSNLSLVRNFGKTKRADIQSVSVNQHTESLEVNFQSDSGGGPHPYPWIFLQDNCTCPECFHQSSQSRKRLMTNLDLNKRIAQAFVAGKGTAVDVTWSDGHMSSFEKPWLIERRFTNENQLQRTNVLRDQPQLFGSDYRIQRANFQEALANPSLLVTLLKVLCKNGVFMLEGAPKEVGQVRKFVSKIGFIRTTHYGDEFTVKSEINASNLAYTAKTLFLHTDLPYYAYPPSVQFLHCIKQYDGDAEGGASHLVDGFAVAAQLKANCPEAYAILSTVPVEFTDIGEDFTKFHKIQHSPTFVHSPSGRLMRIVYNNMQLSSCLPVPLEQVRSLYHALKHFTNLCHDPKNLMKFKLKEGEILVFDNWRLLHGRAGFDESKGTRHIEGCYMDFDEIYSSMRVLEADLNSDNHLV